MPWIIPYLITIAISIAISVAATVVGILLQPKGKKRDGSAATLQLGEIPRGAVFGEIVLAGSLIDAFNAPGSAGSRDNEWECLVFGLADHPIDAIVGFYVDDQYYAWKTPGSYSRHYYGAPFRGEGRNSSREQLELEAGLGQGPTFTAPALALARGGGRWGTNDKLSGMAWVCVGYYFDPKLWPNGRPRFRWRVRGLRCYDPRKDSTVSGGSGAHRWGTPSTYEWTANAAVCRYNYVRGVYALGQLMVGPGRTAEELPPEDVIAPANVCDEDVALAGGGVEPRYRFNDLVSANTRWIEIEEDFARAMAGKIASHGGVLSVIPGAAQSIAMEITDEDLMSQFPVTWQPRLARDQLINTTSTRFTDPMQLWTEATTPLRRSMSDIESDRDHRESETEALFVTSYTQAQRIAEISRRRARYQGTGSITLSPAACLLEPGDWIGWTSARFFGGSRRVFELQTVSIDETGLTTLSLREIGEDVFAWNPATDEQSRTHPEYLAAGRQESAVINNFAANATSIAGADGVRLPAIAASWSAADESIPVLRLEYRQAGSAVVLTQTAPAGDGAALISAGLGSAVEYEVRATPIPQQAQRGATPTAWRAVTLPALAINVGANLVDPASATPTVPLGRAQIITSLGTSSDTTNVAGVPSTTVIAALAALDAVDVGAATALQALSDADAAARIDAAAREHSERSILGALGYLDGLPLGVTVAEQRTISEGLVRDVALIGGRSESGAAFVLNTATAMVSPTESLAARLSSTQASLGGLEARTLITEQSSVTLDGRTSALLGLGAFATGGATPSAARFVLSASGAVSQIVAAADSILFTDSGGLRPLLRLNGETGQAIINDALIRRLQVLPNLAATVSFPVALRPKRVAGAHGAVIAFGGSLGGVPLIDAVPFPPPVLASGETYDVRAVDVTATQMTVRAVKLIPGAPSAQSSGAGSNAGGTPAWRAQKPTAADANNGAYTYTYSASIPLSFVDYGTASGGGLFLDPDPISYGPAIACYEGQVDVYVQTSAGWVRLFTDYLSEQLAVSGSIPASIAVSRSVVAQFSSALGQRAGSEAEFGLHALGSSSIVSFAGVSYSTQTDSGETALAGSFAFDIYPPS